MDDPLAIQPTAFGHLTAREKREHLDILTEVVSDLEFELTRARTERAALIDSLQADLARGR